VKHGAGLGLAIALVANGVNAQTPILGRVYDPNPVVAMSRTTDVELLGLTSTTRLEGQRVRVTTCGSSGAECVPEQNAIAGVDGNFLFAPVEPSRSDRHCRMRPRQFSAPRNR